MKAPGRPRPGWPGQEFPPPRTTALLNFDVVELSIEVLAQQGYRPDLARSHAALGVLQRDQGQLVEARRNLETAMAHFREMGFGRELELTRRELP